MKLVWFLVGLGAGATAALVFAPKSGEETRQTIFDKVEPGKQYAKDKVHEFSGRASDAAEDAKEELANQTNAIAAAAASAREAYQGGSREEYPARQTY